MGEHLRMRRRERQVHQPARVPVTRGLSLRSRVPGNWHARFCSRGEESDFLIDCNVTAARVRFLLNVKGHGVGGGP